MKDNFDVHKWNLERYLNESQESKQTNENQERKQTVVDWLYVRMFENNGRITKEEYEQAKEMEANQHSETWVDSRIADKGDDYIGKQKSFEEYYNETYSK